jgi:hypothetical protein
MAPAPTAAMQAGWQAVISVVDKAVHAPAQRVYVMGSGTMLNFDATELLLPPMLYEYDIE